MGNEKIYFGIQFPEGFELNDEQRRKLSKLLFLSPTTSAKEAKKILSNSKLISVINLLIENLSCELDNIQKKTDDGSDTNSQNAVMHMDEEDDVEFDDVLSVEKVIQRKIDEWVVEFGFPTEEEIIEASNELKVVKVEKWIQTLRKAHFKQLNSPALIAEYLSLYVIGQPEAVKTMSIILNEQKMRLQTTEELPKSSGLFIGSTGTGKTLLVNKGKEILDVPMVRISSGELVPSGVVGNTINKYLTTLHQSSGADAEKTSRGIMFFDEIDKISKFYHPGDDEWKTTIQLELIKLSDLNENICFPSSHEQYANPVEIKVNNLLLLFSGAFSGIEGIILARMLQEFDGNLKLIDQDNLMKYCNTEDIQAYGIIPELAGRMSYICPLRSLQEDDIYKIMTTAKGSDLSKHMKKCEMMGLSLRFSDDALRLIAGKVVCQKLGARYINTILNILLRDVYFNAAGSSEKEFIIDRDYVARVVNVYKFQLIYDAFEKNANVMAVAEEFELSLDKAFDLYLEWKSLKMEEKNYVI